MFVRTYARAYACVYIYSGLCVVCLCVFACARLYDQDTDIFDFISACVLFHNIIVCKIIIILCLNSNDNIMS